MSRLPRLLPCQFAQLSPSFGSLGLPAYLRTLVKVLSGFNGRLLRIPPLLPKSAHFCWEKLPQVPLKRRALNFPGIQGTVVAFCLGNWIL